MQSRPLQDGRIITMCTAAVDKGCCRACPPSKYGLHMVVTFASGHTLGMQLFCPGFFLTDPGTTLQESLC